MSPIAIGQLIDQHWGPLLAWVGAQDEAAEDIVQRAFIALATEAIVPENPVAWLYTTTRNLRINEHIQRQRRSRRESDVARPESVRGNLGFSAEALELLQMLEKLSSQQREVVVARLWGGLSFEEIAGTLQTSRATAWRHYQSALEQLRSLYGVSCPNNE